MQLNSYKLSFIKEKLFESLKLLKRKKVNPVEVAIGIVAVGALTYGRYKAKKAYQTYCKKNS